MKIRELFENVPNEKSLIGKKISGKIIIKETGNEFWNGKFACRNKYITSLEGAPKRINGDFDCSTNDLTSLEGMPQEGVRTLTCSGCSLTSLKGAPKKIDGNFECYRNFNLTSLKGISQEGVQNISCTSCNLTSLVGAPKKINGNFECDFNKNLTSLKGCPQEGVKKLICNDCNLTSLEGAPKKIDGNFSCANNPITSLKGIHKIIEEINGITYLPDSIESNILGLLKIKNLKKIEFLMNKRSGKSKEEISDIINSYLPNPSPSQIIDCQNELIDAGFEEYAEL